MRFQSFRMLHFAGLCLPASCHEEVVRSLADRFIREIVGIDDFAEAKVALKEVECHGLNDSWPEARVRFHVINKSSAHNGLKVYAHYSNLTFVAYNAVFRTLFLLRLRY